MLRKEGQGRSWWRWGRLENGEVGRYQVTSTAAVKELRQNRANGEDLEKSLPRAWGLSEVQGLVMLGSLIFMAI